MQLPTSFYRDEVRCGFYIPTAIKQAWGAGLMILSEIDRICRKHDITYFAEWGTLLGTVRHGGFVPWDDDMDICMKREDYNKFLQVAEKELPKEFAIHNYRTKENHWLFLSRIVNCNQICFEAEHLEKYHNFPYIATVDIFIQDYLYKDEEKEQERCKEIMYILALADSIVNAGYINESKRILVDELVQKYHCKIDTTQSAREVAISLYELAELQMARVPACESDFMGQIFPKILKGGKGLPKSYYEKMIRLPFEDMTIPVPSCYNEILTSRYGNYMEVHKVWVGHDYPYFEGQRANLQAVADFDLPEYRFEQSMVCPRKHMMMNSDSLKNLVSECVNEIEQLHEQMENGLYDKAYDLLFPVLPECQQLAVDLGTLIETAKGETHEISVAIVSDLQEYCNSLYSLYMCLQNEDGNLQEAMDVQLLNVQYSQLLYCWNKVCSTIENRLMNAKEVVFLTTGATQWRAFEHIYKKVVEDEQTDVYVVPLPVFEKNAYEQIRVTENEINAALNKQQYPEYLSLIDYRAFDMVLHHPDVIYIQDPYDGENPCLSIPPQFYAKYLLTITEKLVYVPAFCSDDFDHNAKCDWYNMKHYVTAPGVIYADYILMNSPMMRQTYIEKLVEFAGEQTRTVWEQKIIVNENENSCLENSLQKKKNILYCIGENEIREKNEEFLMQVKERLQVFAENRNEVNVHVCFYPFDLEIWDQSYTPIKNQLVDLISQFERNQWCFNSNMTSRNYRQLVDEYNAYYGSPSPVVLEFVNKKKPVMISM